MDKNKEVKVYDDADGVSIGIIEYVDYQSNLLKIKMVDGVMLLPLMNLKKIELNN